MGDYVVLSENFPCEEDLLKGNFNAGVRFYIKYEDISIKDILLMGIMPLK